MARLNRISYEPEQLSQVINSYLEHLEFDFHRASDYLDWRAEILPFLAEQATKGRELLFSPPFIAALTDGKPETRFMCHLALRNIIEAEFIDRLKEIEQARKPLRKD